MDYWKRVCNDPSNKEYKTEEQINNYKNETLKFIEESNYDFLLLQETNPLYYFSPNDFSNEKWPFEFSFSNRNIYFQRFSRLEWGNAIVANNKYKKIDINRGGFKDDYYSKIGQMFYNFLDSNGNITMIINIYNKCKDGIWETYYETLENIIVEVGRIIENKSNLIVLAGDFNCSVQPTQKYPNGDPKCIDLFKEIENLGFVDITKNIGSTVSFIDYQNDYIFVKNNNSKNVTVKKHDDNKIVNCSDHYLIECEIITAQ